MAEPEKLQWERVIYSLPEAEAASGVILIALADICAQILRLGSATVEKHMSVSGIEFRVAQAIGIVARLRGYNDAERLALEKTIWEGAAAPEDEEEEEENADPDRPGPD